ncbi:hypothetical protein [Sinorhizobium psoraleae]|uniref:hypothetical protein n=1 Tax=Sinorhizobium psoraleae TaxID=520838 RepID=UPI00156986F4|nr:hypothetical protein [Sinorhizobium psoraleae]
MDLGDSRRRHWHELNFWLWAFMRNADAYLLSSAALDQEFSSEAVDWQASVRKHEFLMRESTLAAHHFVTSMGVLIRVLKLAQNLFPEVQPPFSRASHLLKEGKELRDMVEHAYGKGGYLTGGGHHPERFIREDAGIAADATSTIIKDGKHWLGNRLCVEHVIVEVQAIKAAADRIKPPRPR